MPNKAWLCLFIFVGSFFQESLQAVPWRLEPYELIGEEATTRLKTRHPEVTSQKHLQDLLIDLGTLVPFYKLEAHLEKGQIVFYGTRARPIGDISVESTTFMMESELESKLQKFLGLVNSKEVLKAIKDEAREHLQAKGFYLAVLSLSITQKSEWDRILLEIEEDYPCRIREIQLGFKLPKGFDFDLEIGDICDEDLAREAIDSLIIDLEDEGIFDYRIGNPKYIFDKSSNSALLSLEGNIGTKKSFAIDSPITELLSEDLSEIEESLTDPDAVSAEIVRNYRQEGYDDVHVLPPTIKESEGGSLYTFEVKPGTRYTIRDIEFEGVKYYPLSELKDLLETDTLFATPYNQELINASIETLKGKYQNDGFWDVKIPFPRVTKDSETGLTKVVYTVTEGKQRLFSELSVKGNYEMSQSTIKDLFSLKEGEPLSWGELNSFEKNIRDLYRQKGYLYASFKIDLIQNRTYKAIQSRIVLEIDEGKRVKFGDVTITGLVQTDEEVVRREIRWEPGDWYDPTLLEDTQSALVRLGIFSTVDINPTNPNALAEKLDVLDYHFKIREGKPGSVVFGPGWSYEDGMRYVIESSYSNIAGTGRKVFAKTKVSEEKRQEKISDKTLLGRTISVGYVEPYVFDLPANGFISLNHRARGVQSRWELSRAGELSLTHELRHFLKGSQVTGFYGQKITRLETDVLQRKPLIDTGDIRIGRVGLRYELDRRDDISWTTSGYKFGTEFTWADYGFGGDLRYFRFDVRYSHYFPIADNWVIALGFSLSKYHNIERRGESVNVLPTSERLHAGGAESNRGFKSRTLGPLFSYYTPNEDGQSFDLNSEEAGGSARGIYKFEIRYHLFSSLGLALFLDSSNVHYSPTQAQLFQKSFEENYDNEDPNNRPEQADQLSENAPYHFDELLRKPAYLWQRNYVSYGLALNFLTPLGSLDFSYGIPSNNCLSSVTTICQPRGIDSKNRLQRGVFHVSIGANF